MSSEKGPQDEKLSQVGAASLLVGAVQCGFSLHQGSQTLWKRKQSLQRIEPHLVPKVLKYKQFPDERPEACRRTTIGSRRGHFQANIFWLAVRTPTMYDFVLFFL